MDQLLPNWLNANVVYALSGVVLYSAVCQTLRFRRITKLQQKFGFETPKRPGFSDMTATEAWQIQKEITEREFPALFEKALQLALFRTYGIPSIAKLLNQTTQLLKKETVAKRYADTAVLIVEMYDNFPTEERGHEAFARLNYLHGHYIKQGRITNDDMLYTLAMFMCNPVEWINKYEWRTLTPMEVCALATTHKEIGTAMHISYDILPSSKTGWKDGLHFYQELDTWAKAYEVSNMIPNPESHQLALATKDLFLSTIPTFTGGAVTQLIAATMDDRLRESIIFEPANKFTKSAFSIFMTLRAFYLRHLSLPRYTPARNISKDQSPEGRRWIELYGITPHYVKPTFWKRWGPSGLLQLLVGTPRPGDEGMCPEGYLRSNVGPRAFEGKGREEFKREMGYLTKMRTGGCPFPGVKS